MNEHGVRSTHDRRIAMIDLYTFTTANGWKISIMLEELGLPYNVHIVDIMKDEQFKPSFLEISPNNKIPAIVDTEGPDGKPISVFESAAIMVYLARKTHSPLLPSDEREFTKTMEWLFFQMASMGPNFGQMGHFVRKAEKIPYAIERFTNESKRILSVMDTQLGKFDYLAGPAYTIADIAAYAWVKVAQLLHFPDLSQWPHMQRWFEQVGARPAVKKGLAIPELKL
jgi:GSH-dependent disulfide-bond oxidoreductase